MGTGPTGECPKVPRLAGALNLLHRGRVADHLNAVERKCAGDLRSGSIVTGHRPKLANLRVHHWEALADVVAENLGIVVKHVVWTGAHADGGRDVPLVVLENHFSRRTNDESCVEPAIRKLREQFNDPTSGDEQVVLTSLLGQHVHFRPGNGDGLVHEFLESGLSLARCSHTLQEILGQHYKAHRPFPEISHPEIDQLAHAVQVFLDVGAVFCNGHRRLDDHSRVFFNFLGHLILWARGSKGQFPLGQTVS